MSQPLLKHRTPLVFNGGSDRRPSGADRHRDYEGVAIILAKMTPIERARAYETGVFTLGELNGAAALRPDLMPTVNGEWEWIALTLADLD
jgi:hypothetical protein